MPRRLVSEVVKILWTAMPFSTCLASSALAIPLGEGSGIDSMSAASLGAKEREQQRTVPGFVDGGATARALAWLLKPLIAKGLYKPRVAFCRQYIQI
jgi:hypothetical protein